MAEPAMQMLMIANLSEIIGVALKAGMSAPEVAAVMGVVLDQIESRFEDRHFAEASEISQTVAEMINSSASVKH